MKLRKNMSTALVFAALSLPGVSLVSIAQANTHAACQDYKAVKPKQTVAAIKSGAAGATFGAAAGKVVFECYGENSNDLFSVIFRWTKGLFGAK